MSERFPHVPAAVPAVLLLGALAGCNDDDGAPTPLVPAACLQTWEEAGYNEEADDGLKLTPAPVDQIPPDLKAAQNDTTRLVGFAASFVASEDEYAVSVDALRARIDSGDLVGLAFEGELPSQVDYDTVKQGFLVAPATDDRLLDGQLNAGFDLSGGAAENAQADWNWEEVYGSEPSTWSVMFLQDGCEEAVPTLEGMIATAYRVDPTANSVEQVIQ